MKCEFNKLHYYHRKYKPKINENRIKVLGIDSESYSNGVPFLFCISDGSIITPDNLFNTLFQRQYRGVKFVCYNLKYDEGSILHLLPSMALNEIRIYGKCEYNGIRFRSIPKKELVLTHIQTKQSVAFYDIAQFYGTSLNKAALYYLGKEKIDIETKTFTPEYVKKNWHTIVKYCIQDAKLTQELADYFIDILINEFEVYPQKLYSTGYITGIHFSRVCDVIDVNRLWNGYRDCLEYAYNSYAGGKFETYQRGFGEFYQYDINSAYPYEIANLQDIRNAEILESKEYQPNATYGFIKCILYIDNDYSPIPLKIDNVNRYPVGIFKKTITKNEYDYLIARGDKIDIINAWWLFCDGTKPYQNEINRLFELKRKFKNTDKLRYMLVKILLNSFYGKFIQVTEKQRDTGKIYECGYLFNPIYASVITANVRLKLSEICDKFPDNIVAVHTDSIITNLDLEAHGFNCNSDLGGWNREANGDGVMVGSGVYQVGNKVHYRGYKSIDSLIDLIMSNRNKKDITIPQRLVLSWRLVVFRNAGNEFINRFVTDDKILNLEFDSKREWRTGWNWQHKLTGSMPFIHADDKIILEKVLTPV